MKKKFNGINKMRNIFVICRFTISVRKFVERWSAEGPAHHMAVGIGHISSRIEKLANLLDMEITRIC